MSHPLVERILASDAPPSARQAAARGALPIPREDLIELWVCLRNDADPDVRIACKESLAAVPEQEWVELLPTHPFRLEVLEFSLLVLGRNPRVLDAALRNRLSPPLAVEKVAGQATGPALDVILDNQTRLIESPGILISMLSNPGIATSQVRRIYDIAEQFFKDNPQVTTLLETRFGLRLGAAGGALRIEVPQIPTTVPPPLPTGPEERAEAAEVSLGLDLDVAPEPLEPGDVIPEALQDVALDEQQVETLYQQVLHMGIPKKVELALKGNKEARGYLIRDSNKTVQLAVVSSPKVTVEEAETYSKMRHLPEEVFRKIALNRNFMKKYSVVKAMIFNPKTPQGLAMGLVKRLNETDMKFLSKDKGVSETVRREAKRTMEEKGKK
jgi:hypothetical protein